EQRKIAAILSTVQKAIETEKALIERTKELKKSMMHKLFTEGIGWLSGAETSQKQTEIGPIPENWEVVRLGEVAEFVRGLSWRKSEEADKQNGKLIISIPNIGEDGINFETKYNHYLIKNIPENKRLHIGDIIFVGSSGSISNIGRNVKINYLPFEEIGFASFTFKATSNKEKINNDFFYYLLNSEWCRYKEFATRAADGKYNFQLKEFINKIQIPLPPLSEQQEIVDILSTIDQKIEHHTTKKQKLEELFRTLLHELMTARVRVNEVELKEVIK
ncbi:MAG TPA: restriction endonuclease subunit S, partial [Victivallales bacterium]|nr:restriction endonuclease subunit S [Victivallales bacterium]